MRVYIVRHGKAVNEGYRVDSDRPLTDEGRARMRRTARVWAKRKEKPPRRWLTSPLVRAVQTCEICVEAFEEDGSVEVTRALEPEAAASSALEAIAQGEGPVAVVSHEPLVSTLASHLLGKPFGGFQKGAVLALSWDPETRGAEFRWLLEPAKEDREPKFRESL